MVLLDWLWCCSTASLPALSLFLLVTDTGLLLPSDASLEFFTRFLTSLVRAGGESPPSILSFFFFSPFPIEFQGTKGAPSHCVPQFNVLLFIYIVVHFGVFWKTLQSYIVDQVIP